MRYRRLFETAQDGILILNADTGQIDDVNPFLTDMLGYTREQLLGNKLWEIGPFKDTKASKAAFRELQREAYVRYEDLPLETRAGKSINVEFVSNVYQVNGSKVIQCNIRNITEAQAGRGQTQGIQPQTSGAFPPAGGGAGDRTPEHRARTSRRNRPGPHRHSIEPASRCCSRRAPQAPAPRLNESLKVVERVLEQVQDISLDLRPSMLDDLGLEPALRWYTDRQAALVGLKVGVPRRPAGAAPGSGD